MLSCLSNQTKGTLYCVIGVLAVTPNSLMVRLVSHMDMFAVQFYSNLIFSVTVSLIFVGQEGLNAYSKFIAIGWLGWLAGLVYGANLVLVVLGFQNTAIATSLVILASNPMFSALFSYFILKEVIPIRTIVASLVCFGSIVLIFVDQIGSGGSSNIDGIIYSLLGSITLAGYFCMLRLASTDEGKEPDMMPCTIIAGYFATFISICTNPDLSSVRDMDWLYLFINGALVLSISYSLWTVGAGLISAPEVSLYTLIETVLGPVWVWLAGYEAPPLMSVYGGSALIAALVIHSVIGIREEAAKSKKQTESHQLVNEEDEKEEEEEEEQVVEKVEEECAIKSIEDISIDDAYKPEVEMSSMA